MTMVQTRMEPGSTLGVNSFMLPGSVIGARASVGIGSLVQRGESIPADTHWEGNPAQFIPAQPDHSRPVQRTSHDRTTADSTDAPDFEGTAGSVLAGREPVPLHTAAGRAAAAGDSSVGGAGRPSSTPALAARPGPAAPSGLQGPRTDSASTHHRKGEPLESSTVPPRPQQPPPYAAAAAAAQSASAQSARPVRAPSASVGPDRSFGTGSSYRGPSTEAEHSDAVGPFTVGGPFDPGTAGRSGHDEVEPAAEPARQAGSRTA